MWIPLLLETQVFRRYLNEILTNMLKKNAGDVLFDLLSPTTSCREHDKIVFGN